MACKGTKVSKKEIKRMWELYSEEEMTFRQIGKKLKRSPDTVSRYIHMIIVQNNTIDLAKKLY